MKEGFNKLLHFLLSDFSDCAGLPESVLSDEDDAVAKVAALLRKNFSQQDERDVAVAHREGGVDEHHQDQRSPAKPVMIKSCTQICTQVI